MNYHNERLRVLDGRLNDLDRQIRSEENLFMLLSRDELQQLRADLATGKDHLQRGLALLAAQDLILARQAAGMTPQDVDRLNTKPEIPQRACLIDYLTEGELSDFRSRLTASSADQQSIINEARGLAESRRVRVQA